MGETAGAPAELSETPKRDDYQKLLDDPYFAYLLEKRTRRQTWAFLSGVGALIVVLLGYGGFQFNSMRELVAGYEKDLTSLSREAQTAARMTQALEKEMAARLVAAERFAENSHSLSSELLRAADSNVGNSRELQGELFSQHKNLLDSVGRINSQAAANVGEVQELLAHLDSQKVPQTLAELQQARDALNQAKETYGAVDDLHRLEDLNARLVKARTHETVTMRKVTSHVVYLPDLSGGISTASDRPQLRAIFSVGKMGKRFELSWVLEGVDGTPLGSGSDLVRAHRKYAANPARLNLFQLGDSGYEYEVEYVNYGLFVRDFAMLRIRPTKTLAPAPHAAPTTAVLAARP